MFVLRYVFRVHAFGMILFPLPSHLGFGSDAGTFHVAHHAKFNYNYGDSPMFDKLLGTYKYFHPEKLRSVTRVGQKLS